MTLLRDNYRELETVVKLSKKHFLRGVVCTFYTNNPAYPDSLFINHKERAIIIKELRRIKEKYPWNFLFTKSMIDWCAEADHSSYCFWRNESLHFDSNWNSRKCFYSDGYCANCACFVGSMQNPLSMWRYIKEVFMLV